MNVGRLRKLADKLDTVPPEKFSLESWSVFKPCGMVACGGGYACTIPEFKKLGLLPDSAAFYMPTYQGRCGFTALAMFFDITHDQSESLFHPCKYRYGHRTRPTTVANKIRRLISKQKKEKCSGN